MTEDIDRGDFATIAELADEFGISPRTLYTKVGTGPIEKRIINGVTYGRRSDCVRLIREQDAAPTRAPVVGRHEARRRSEPDGSSGADPESEARKRLLLQAKIERDQRAMELERMAARRELEREIAHEEELRQEAELRRREADLRLEEQRFRIEQAKAHELEQREREREERERTLRAQEQQRKREREEELLRREAERRRQDWMRLWVICAENWMRSNDIPDYQHRQGVDAVRHLLDRELSPEDQAHFTRNEVESVLASIFASNLKEKEEKRKRQDLLDYTARIASSVSSGCWGKDAAHIREAANAAAQSALQNGELSIARLAVDRAVRQARDEVDKRRHQREQEERRLQKEAESKRERSRLQEQWDREERDLLYQVNSFLFLGSSRAKEVALSEATELLNKFRKKGRSPTEFSQEVRRLLREIADEVPLR